MNRDTEVEQLIMRNIMRLVVAVSIIAITANFVVMFA